MFGFISKSEYELIKKTNERLENYIIDLEKKQKNNRETINKLTLENSQYEKFIFDYDKEINNLKNECDVKEYQRRKSAGKLGICKRKLNSALREKQEMMELINNLICERQKIMKLNKKPTIEEMKKYFKKYY